MAARIEYIELNAELQLRERTWVRWRRRSTWTSSRASMQRAGWRILEPPHHYVDATTGVEMVEVHADDFEDTESIAWNSRQVSVRFKELRERRIGKSAASRAFVRRQTGLVRWCLRFNARTVDSGSHSILMERRRRRSWRR